MNIKTSFWLNPKTKDKHGEWRDEIEVKVSFDYYPQTDDTFDEPGTWPYVDYIVTEVVGGGLLTTEQLKVIEDLCYEYASENWRDHVDMEPVEKEKM